MLEHQPTLEHLGGEIQIDARVSRAFILGARFPHDDMCTHVRLSLTQYIHSICIVYAYAHNISNIRFGLGCSFCVFFGDVFC